MGSLYGGCLTIVAIALSTCILVYLINQMYNGNKNIIQLNKRTNKMETLDESELFIKANNHIQNSDEVEKDSHFLPSL